VSWGYHLPHKTQFSSQQHFVFHLLLLMKTENREQPKKRSKRTEGSETSVRNEEREEERRRRKKELRQKSLTDGAVDEKSRHSTKALRQREKMIQRLAALGLDENGEKLDNYSLLKYPVREWMISLPGAAERIAVNPFVTLIGIVLLWGIIGWSGGTLRKRPICSVSYPPLTFLDVWF
jgi:hypothetical protein